jgi:hypothetical protein
LKRKAKLLAILDDDLGSAQILFSGSLVKQDAYIL